MVGHGTNINMRPPYKVSDSSHDDVATPEIWCLEENTHSFIAQPLRCESSVNSVGVLVVT
jgi:hypothetical protein